MQCRLDAQAWLHIREASSHFYLLSYVGLSSVLPFLTASSWPRPVVLSHLHLTVLNYWVAAIATGQKAIQLFSELLSG